MISIYYYDVYDTLSVYQIVDRKHVHKINRKNAIVRTQSIRHFYDSTLRISRKNRKWYIHHETMPAINNDNANKAFFLWGRIVTIDDLDISDERKLILHIKYTKLHIKYTANDKKPNQKFQWYS